MSLFAVKNKFNDLMRTVGKVNLNANYPEEFELYLFAFELLTSDGRSLKYFIFPDNPNAIREQHSFANTVEKTMGGISVLSNPSFLPVAISIDGTFGRRLRLLIGKQSVVLAGQYVDNQIQTLKSTGNLAKGKVSLQTFDTQVKTGYGCIKILQNILYESKLLDNGQQRILLFYNLASGNSYVVNPDSFELDQNNKESNMIWRYSLKMTGVAPADSFTVFDSKNFRSVQQQLAVNQFAQDRANDVIGFINKFVNVNDVFRDVKLFDTPEVKNVINSIGQNQNQFGSVFVQKNVFDTVITRNPFSNFSL